MATEQHTINEAAQMLESPLPREVLAQLYGAMVKARTAEQNIRGAMHTSEAILAATLQNTEPEDVIVTPHPHPVLEVLLGAEMNTFLRPKLARQKNGELAATASRSVVANEQSALGIAAGFALALKRAQSPAITIAIVPGKLTKGLNWEQTIRFAAEQRVPLIIIADSTASRSSRSHDGKYLSHWPFPTIAVDGRDVIAMYRVTKEAFSSARKGHGPTLIDCVDFVAPGNRGKDTRDPIASFRGYLQRHNAWSDEYANATAELSSRKNRPGR